MYNRCTGIYKFGNNTYPRRIRRRSNLGHIFGEKKCGLWAGQYGNFALPCLFLGAFAKFRKAIISFVMSVRPSVHMKQFGSHWKDFHEIWYWIFVENLSRNCSTFIKTWQE